MSTDYHQHLHYGSSHPEHTKRPVLFSQTLKIRRFCSKENDFKYYRSQCNIDFLKENIQRNLLRIYMRKVKEGWNQNN